MRPTLVVAALMVALAVPPRSPAAPDTADTRLLHSPAVSKDHVAFVYAGDLWVCDLDGRNARRLTSHPRSESDPVFSPDGQTIAYSGQYESPAPGPGMVGSNV